jgi:hypothetical protein
MPIGLGHVRQSKSSPAFQDFQDRLEDEMISGGAYQPEVCARCVLNGSRLCTRNGCDMAAQDAIVYLNGGRQPDPPRVQR